MPRHGALHGGCCGNHAHHLRGRVGDPRCARSEDVRLSDNNGYVGADSLWSYTSQVGTQDHPASSLNKEVEQELAGSDKTPASAEVTQLDHAGLDQAELGVSSGLPKECFLGCSGGGGGQDEDHQHTQVTLQKAKTTNLRVILIANNLGGRTKIDCNDTTVSIFDFEAPYGPIGRLELGNFTVPPQTRITLQKRPKITDTSYIWNNYRGEARFSVMVQVNASVTSYPLGKPTQTKPQSYMCQPVTVGLIGDEAIYATNQGGCREAS
ncbi:hypothetical protein BAE44_0005610 [Dichanthelium oligosanthes]|uniref:Uncharacterized protein n=1 Tax=Dichanthelium oligosanthes TaxID=888268 RepID=A0A1E5W7Y8_9POAL|nr:hypothetical protein BAE44_0005610 [Dichanthelium oligosanthes]